jgi:hypothetical protein
MSTRRRPVCADAPPAGVGALWWRLLGPRLDDSQLVGEYHRLGPVPDLELVEDVLDVGLDGAFAQKQTLRDL